MSCDSDNQSFGSSEHKSGRNKQESGSNMLRKGGGSLKGLGVLGMSVLEAFSGSTINAMYLPASEICSQACWDGWNFFATNFQGPSFRSEVS